jgi:hypothetical protein
MLLAAATSSLFALAAPSLASARHSKCHGRSHHACSHVRHAHHARIVKFGASASTTAPSGTTPTAPTGETAGKVASFEGGVLTITLNDGSSVSGKVTEQTEISCQSATPTSGDDADEQGDESSGGNGEDSSHVRLSSRGDDLSAGGGGDDDEDGGQSSSCTSTALVPGAVVREAELSIGGGGSVWKHIDLIQ